MVEIKGQSMKLFKKLDNKLTYGSYWNGEAWQIAKKFYGDNIAKKLYDSGDPPDALLDSREQKAFQWLLAEGNALKKQISITSVSPAERLEATKKALNILDEGGWIKWQERFEDYKKGHVFRDDAEHDSLDEDSRQPSVEIGYSTLADRVFAISLELMQETTRALEEFDISAFSATGMQMSAMASTNLYTYAVLVLRERVKEAFDNQHEFEKEDNKMIEVFAKKLMVPAVEFLKNVDRSTLDGRKACLIPLQRIGINIEDYIDRVGEAVSAWSKP